MAPPFPLEFVGTVLRRFEGRPPGGYALVANVGRIPGEFEIAPDMVMRRASPEEAHEIGVAIDFSFPAKPQNPYVTELTPRGSFSYEPVILPPEEWRYVVIVHDGGNVRAHLFADASLLTPWSIGLGFCLGNGSGGVGGGHLPALEFVLEQAIRVDFRLDELTLTQLEIIRSTFSRLVEFEHATLDIKKRLGQFRAVLEMRRHPSLRFVGLVGILESVVTHDPDPKDPTDSLSRQIKKKMALLGKRFEFPLPYQEHFGTERTDKVWSDLYSARSAFAHGGEPDFARKLKLLRNLDNATAFMRLAVSAVLRQALLEPQLVLDLQDC